MSFFLQQQGLKLQLFLPLSSHGPVLPVHELPGSHPAGFHPSPSCPGRAVSSAGGSLPQCLAGGSVTAQASVLIWTKEWRHVYNKHIIHV